MNAKELELISDILMHSYYEMCSHGDYDKIDDHIFSNWTEEEKKQFCPNIHFIIGNEDIIFEIDLIMLMSKIVKTHEFNIKEYKLLIDTLDMANHRVSLYICNDVDKSIWENWSIEERQVLVQQYHKYNLFSDEYNPKYLDLFDYMILFVMKKKLEEEFSSYFAPKPKIIIDRDIIINLNQ